MLSYPRLNFAFVANHPYQRDPDPFWAFIVMGSRNVGMWKRSVRADTVEVRVRLAPSLDESERQRVRMGTERLAEFLGRQLSYVEEQHAG